MLYKRQILLDWEKVNNIEESKRQKIQQEVIYELVGITYTILQFDNIDNKKIIIDIGGGYSVWSSLFLNIHINKLNNITIQS